MAGETAAWHLVAGDWQELPPGDERGRGLWAAIGESVRAYVALDRDERARTSVLALPFYRSAQSPDARLALYELAIPPDVDDLGLERWCYVLWDGADFVQSMTWLNDALYLGEQGWDTILVADDGKIDAGLVDLYARYFCAFIAAENAATESPTPFMLVDSPPRRDANGRVLPRADPVVVTAGSPYWPRIAAAALEAGLEGAAAWLERNAAVLASDPEFGHYAEPLSLALASIRTPADDVDARARAEQFARELLTRMAAGESLPPPNGPCWYTPPLRSPREVVRCLYGYHAFDVQMKLARNARDVTISFLDDAGVEDFRVDRPLWVKRWRDLAFVCRETT